MKRYAPAEATVDLIRRARVGGLTLREIQEEMGEGWTLSRIHKLLKDCPSPRAQMRAKVRAAIESGMTYRAVEDALGVSYKLVWTVGRTMDLPRGRRKAIPEGVAA